MSHHHRHSSNQGFDGSGNQDAGFQSRLHNFIGETVTIFTTGGGASGLGFTGVILFVNSDFVRLMTAQGSAPANPSSDNSLNGRDNGTRNNNSAGRINNFGPGNDSQKLHTAGSICDIPINRIAAFSHNAI